MKVIADPVRMQKISLELKRQGKKIGFVPTMGFLHRGHMSLVSACRKECDVSVMSIYVNPLQFGPKEDFKNYPRDLKHDKTMARKAGVDILFLPSDKSMYGHSNLTQVQVRKITESLCGASRPGHFNGVTTVVAKLFNIVLPEVAYFGQKDAQQVAVIRKMTQDLNFPVKVKVLPTVRELDGLAMSSRNSYLDEKTRKEATVLSRSLQLGRAMIQDGERDAAKIKYQMKRLITSVESARIDYISIVDADDLTALKKITGKILIAEAVFFGRTRLIDNLIVDLKKT